MIFHPNSVLITGIDVDPDEPDMTRVYVGHRSDWKYVLVDADTARMLRSEYGSCMHLTTVLDRDAVIYHDPDGQAAAREWFRKTGT